MITVLSSCTVAFCASSTIIIESLSPVISDTPITLTNVNKQLIEEGHAVAYYGGKR